MKKPTRPTRSMPGGVKSAGIWEENQTPCSAKAKGSPVQSRFSPPNHLRPDTGAWWQSVAAGYALEAHHVRILTLAAEAWDRGQEAREAIAKHGAVYVDRFDQPRARPEVSIERDARIAFARLVRELALDLDPPDEAGRPPRLGVATAKQPARPSTAAAPDDWDEDDRRILGLD